jgi:hypothetical protein
MQKRCKRQDIIKATFEVFAPNGFRGTTTPDLAAHAEVNEAIIISSLSHRVPKAPDSAAGKH